MTCDFYAEPDQTCMTAGLEVVAAEGLCGKCAVRLIEPDHTAREAHPATMIGRK